MLTSISATQDLWDQAAREIARKPTSWMLAALLTCEFRELTKTIEIKIDDDGVLATDNPPAALLHRHNGWLLAGREYMEHAILDRIQTTDTWDHGLQQLWVDPDGFFTVDVPDHMCLETHKDLS